MKIEKLQEHLRKVLEYAMRNHCTHEETHRGGAIWEICDSCGAKWADDEGGKPKNAHDYPKVYQEAFDYLNSERSKYKEIDFCKIHPGSRMSGSVCVSCVLGWPPHEPEKIISFCNSCASLDLCREMHECMNERD